MELRQLEYFLAVVEHGTFTAAATRLNVVQSGVSSTIKALERSLGAPLFDRSAGPGRPSLTAAGQVLLPEARGLLEAARVARERVAGPEVHGELHVGVITIVGPVNLPDLLSRFREVHPHVRVRLRVHPRGSADMAEALRAGTLDVAFTSVTETVDPALHLHEITRDPLVLLLPRDHPLAAAPLTLAALASETWIDAPAGYGNRTITDTAFVRAGLAREVALEVTDTNSVPDYVAAGLGIGFVPAGVQSDPATITRRTIPDEDLRWPLYLATTHDRLSRPTIRTFLNLLTRG